MSRDLVGATLGKYRCEQFIGLGGMAEVYRAVDSELEREVALKVLHPFFVSEEGFTERFRREARTLASLRHPNIVQVYDSGIQDFNSYLAMEYVPGPTLKDCLRDLNMRNERMPLAEVRRIGDALLASLRYAHRANVVHRDLKPSNVILAGDGRVVLTDFGLAKIVGSTIHTASMSMIGTPAYMAPEQAQAGTVDPRSDIYSVGVMLFEMLTGRLPFEADTPFAMIAKHAKETFPSAASVRRDLPRGLDRVLLIATAKDPSERFQSIDQFADALNAVFEGRRLPFILPRLRLPRTARNWILGGAAAAIVLLGLGSFQGWFSAASPTLTPTITPSPTPSFLAFIIGQTRLHEQPDLTSRVVGELSGGTLVELLVLQAPWWQVRSMDDAQLTGWVLTVNLDLIPTPTPLPTLTNTPPPGASLTPTPTASATPRPSATPSATLTRSPTPTATPGESGPIGSPPATATPLARTPTRAPTQISTSPPSPTNPPPTPTRTPVPPTLTPAPPTPTPSVAPWTPTSTSRLPTVPGTSPTPTPCDGC
ncbi:MAG TPA: protein kinase [Anaerolineae bacterium]|nr:protein kinase [Anaerolineae bacterium]